MMGAGGKLGYEVEENGPVGPKLNVGTKGLPMDLEMGPSQREMAPTLRTRQPHAPPHSTSLLARALKGHGEHDDDHQDDYEDARLC